MGDDFIRHTFPKLAVAAVVGATAIPWGLPDNAVFALPLAAMMLVFLFSCLRGSELHPGFVFLTGLLTDILTAGPLGFWALVFLIAFRFGRGVAPFAPGLGTLGLWLAFALAAPVIAAIGWSVASLYFLRLLDPYPMGVGLAVVVMLFPFAASAVDYLTRVARPGSSLTFRG